MLFHVLRKHFIFYLETKIQAPRRAFKRRAEQDLPHQSISGIEQCSNVPSSHSPVKKRKVSGIDSDSVTQLQKESSILNTAHLDSLPYTPAVIPQTSRSSPRGLDPSSQTCKRTTSTDEALPKNKEKQETSSSIIVPQQKESCTNTNTIRAVSSMKVQEIARISEKRPLEENSLTENAWNYENRQFRSESPSITNINLVSDGPNDTVAMDQQCTRYSVHNYNDALKPHYSRNVPDETLDTSLAHNATTKLYLSVVPEQGTVTSVPSQVTPEYAMSYQYPRCEPPDYPLGTAVSNTVTPGNPISTNSALPLHIVQQPHLFYQPTQSFQDLETLNAYYTCYTYNPALQTNQVAASNGNVSFKPAFEHGTYPLSSWPQVSAVLTSQTFYLLETA